ncbi:MAG: nicotinate-nucleotide--dimethylbenzimidazole phosphoribosyltransferase [Kineosporiaceae bacterium]
MPSHPGVFPPENSPENLPEDLPGGVSGDRVGTPPAPEPGHGSDVLARVLAGIGPADPGARDEAWARQHRLTKPPGSLGALEEVAARLCGLAGVCPPPVPRPVAVAVFAGDHGVHARGVTPWPQEVTGQMVVNFLTGGAAVNVLAAQVGADVVVVDVGLAHPVPAGADPLPAPGSPDGTSGRGRLVSRRVRAGTADLAAGPAMSRDEALRAIEAGIGVAEELVAAGYGCLVTGDMGIANTTASAALVAAFTGADPGDTTGRGTGIDEATWRHKVSVLRAALDLHRPDPADPVGVLAAVGGLEHAALAGYLLAAAARRVPVVLDGVIATSAALVAAALAPDAVDAFVAGHRSPEPGQGLALRHLGLAPLLDLGLRLGEGTGAVLAVPLVQAAARTLGEMATFDSAGVAHKDG